MEPEVTEIEVRKITDISRSVPTGEMRELQQCADIASSFSGKIMA